MKETERLESVYMDEFDNKTAREAGNMEETIQEALEEVGRDPKNQPSVSRCIPASAAGPTGKVWDIWATSAVWGESRSSPMTGQLSTSSHQQDERSHPNDHCH